MSLSITRFHYVRITLLNNNSNRSYRFVYFIGTNAISGCRQIIHTIARSKIIFGSLLESVIIRVDFFFFNCAMHINFYSMDVL